MRDKLRPVLRILDFFVPIEVLSSVFLVFVMENVLSLAVGDIGIRGWITIYVIGLILLSVIQYLSADADEMEELREDIEDV